jgi:hypothetical protein
MHIIRKLVKTLCLLYTLNLVLSMVGKIIPINIVTFILGYKKYPLFEAKEEEKELKNWMNENE